MLTNAADRAAARRFAACLLIGCLMGAGCSSEPDVSTPNPDEASTVEALRALGGMVQLNMDSPDRRAIVVDLSTRSMNDENVALIAKLPDLQAVRMNYTDVGDAGIEHLLGLEKLTEIGLQQTRVTPQGAQKLRQRFPQANIDYSPKGR